AVDAEDEIGPGAVERVETFVERGAGGVEHGAHRPVGEDRSFAQTRLQRVGHGVRVLDARRIVGGRVIAAADSAYCSAARRRCRAASNRTTAPATAALSDSTPAASGIDASAVARAETASPTPSASEPTMTAAGPRQSIRS